VDLYSASCQALQQRVSSGSYFCAAPKEYPHRVKYSLTLHDRYGKRLLGFDNAHLIKTRKRGRFIGRAVAYDHKHMGPDDEGVPYVFESAEQLLADFFTEVDKVLNGMK